MFLPARRVSAFFYFFYHFPMDPFSVFIGFIVSCIFGALLDENEKRRTEPPPQQRQPIVLLPKHFEVKPNVADRLCACGILIMMRSANSGAMCFMAAALSSHREVYGWVGFASSLVAVLATVYVVVVGNRPGKPIYVRPVPAADATSEEIGQAAG